MEDIAFEFRGVKQQDIHVFAMLPVYNTVLFVVLLLTWPLLVIFALSFGKYRNRLGQRLGWRGARSIRLLVSGKRPVIWVHALSVGEVTSAAGLLAGLRHRYPQGCLVLSTTTASGERVAWMQLSSLTDAIIASPLDLPWVVNRFIRNIDPDLFILVETDFWPNWLSRLRSAQVPLLLVNGRISDGSFQRYYRFRFFFRSIFGLFSRLAMQTQADARKMAALCPCADRIEVLGNLKYIPPVQTNNLDRHDLGIASGRPVWVCGSTHEGEEEVILAVFRQLRQRIADLFLVLAPRDVARSASILHMARSMGLVPRRRTEPPPTAGEDLVVLDTLGELSGCYHVGQVAFVGGSLVAAGGHNPLEAARARVPVLFGPHMEDFEEIATDLIHAGGARMVHSREELLEAVAQILLDSTRQRHMQACLAHAGLAWGQSLQAHLNCIDQLLGLSGP